MESSSILVLKTGCFLKWSFRLLKQIFEKRFECHGKRIGIQEACEYLVSEHLLGERHG